MNDTETKTITVNQQQFDVIVDAISVRLAMGRFELEELNRHFGGVAVDAVVSTQAMVDELAGVLDVLVGECNG